MFEKLLLLEQRYDEINEKLSMPEVYSDPQLSASLQKELKDLTPVVEKFRDYQVAKTAMEEAQELMSSGDRELNELAKEEFESAKQRMSQDEEEIKLLLLPKDPNDDKNVIVEIRAGAGGDEAAPIRESVSAGRAAWQKMLGNDSCRSPGENLTFSGKISRIDFISQRGRHI